jgi:hypothetical protein
VPVGPFFPRIPEWAWKALAEVARDAPEQFPRALSEALAAVRASSPQLARTTMEQLVKSLALGTAAPLGAAPEVLTAIEALGGVTEAVVAGEAAVATAGAVAGGTAVAAAAAEAAGGTGAAAGAAGTAAAWLGGLSVGALAIGALVVGGLVIGGVVWYRHSSACACERPASGVEATAQVFATGNIAIVTPGKTTAAIVTPGKTTAAIVTPGKTTAAVVTPGKTTAATCGPAVKEVRLCADSPKGAAAQACGPGFCWDGGFNHSLACKQEDLPAHAHRSYTNDVLCDDGYSAAVNACTSVVTACTKK